MSFARGSANLPPFILEPRGLAPYPASDVLVGISSMPEAQQVVRGYFALASIQAVAMSPEAADGAIEAFDRFGKGRHPAGRNFGDCFTYTCPRSYRMPLLFRGNNFALIDISAA